MKIALVAAHAPSLTIFRGDLIRRLCSAGDEVLALAGPTEQPNHAAISALGARFIEFPVQRNGLNPLSDFQTWLSLWKIFRREKPDVVLAYTIKPIIWGGLALWFIRKPRFYALITGLGYAFQVGASRGWLTRIVSLFYRISLMRAEKVIFQNLDDMDEFVRRGIVPRSKCYRVFGSGVNLARYDFKPTLAVSPLFLGIGRLLGEKGFREYCQAAKIVKSTYPAARFQWVGSTDPSPNGISLAEVRSWHELGIIEYLGEAKDVRPFLADCSVFVLPSYYREGVPRTILEAMSTGRPILTTDNVGCRDTVIQGLNGYLVPKSDPVALADRMIWFIEHPERWQAMGEASRRIAEGRFDVHKVNAEMLRIMGLNAHA